MLDVIFVQQGRTRYDSATFYHPLSDLPRAAPLGNALSTTHALLFLHLPERLSLPTPDASIPPLSDHLPSIQLKFHMAPTFPDARTARVALISLPLRVICSAAVAILDLSAAPVLPRADVKPRPSEYPDKLQISYALDADPRRVCAGSVPSKTRGFARLGKRSANGLPLVRVQRVEYCTGILCIE